MAKIIRRAIPIGCIVDCEQSLIFLCKVTVRETQARERRAVSSVSLGVAIQALQSRLMYVRMIFGKHVQRCNHYFFKFQIVSLQEGD